MAGKSIKIGDVFSVKLDDKNKKFFQYIANDLTQLNSDVIRSFKQKYPIDDNPELARIVEDEVDFYAHCILKIGVKMKVWDVWGNSQELGKLNDVLFRGTSDSGSRPGEQILVSNKWYIWKINDLNFTSVGKLEGENRKAELGVVVNPYDIKDRMITGSYNFFYPGYE